MEKVSRVILVFSLQFIIISNSDCMTLQLEVPIDFLKQQCLPIVLSVINYFSISIQNKKEAVSLFLLTSF